MLLHSLSKMLVVPCIDPSLGRLEYTLLPDHSLMEMLFEGFDAETKKRCQDTDGMYLDVCEWPCVGCDDEERVTQIGEYNQVSGSLYLCYIPPNVESFAIPDSQLSGSIDLTQLPQRIKGVELWGNRLTGTVDLTHLPQRLNILYLHHNQFSGSIDLTKLPQGMFYLNLENNCFTGAFVATDLPHRLDMLNAQGNQFFEIAVVDSQTKARIDIRESGVKAVVDENGNAKDKGVWF